VIDGDRRVRTSLECLIGVADGFACVCAVSDPAEALRVLETVAVDAVLIDPRLPDVDVGMALLAEAHRRWPQLALVAMSGSDELAPELLRNGAISFVAKSGQPDELLAELARCVDRRAIV
jgi:DNA-binding NtrC family response regulator